MTEGSLLGRLDRLSEQQRDIPENIIPLSGVVRALAEMGEDKSALLYNHLKPGQNPNYPKGKEDNTHFNELGARKMAELVLQGIRELQLPLANYTVDHQ